MKEKLDRIFIAETDGRHKVFGDLKRCEICDINFTAIQPCIMCAMRTEKEQELGRRLTKEEFDKLFEWLK